MNAIKNPVATALVAIFTSGCAINPVPFVVGAAAEASLDNQYEIKTTRRFDEGVVAVIFSKKISGGTFNFVAFDCSNGANHCYRQKTLTLFGSTPELYLFFKDGGIVILRSNRGIKFPLRMWLNESIAEASP